MTLYKAKKGNIEFYIQPDMLEIYAAAGYEIVKLVEVTVEDIQAEMEKAIEQMHYRGSANVEGTEEK